MFYCLWWHKITLKKLCKNKRRVHFFSCPLLTMTCSTTVEACCISIATLVMLRCYCVLLYLQCLSCCTVCMLTSYNTSFHRYVIVTTIFFLNHHLKNEGSCYSHTQISTFYVLVPSWKWSLPWGVIVFVYMQHICNTVASRALLCCQEQKCWHVKMKGSNDEIMWNAILMQQGNFIDIFLAWHVSDAYAHHQEH